MIILTGLLTLLTGCFTMKYSFSGASIHPDIKTVSVQYFENRALDVQPGLSQEFTDALRDKIESQTNLMLVNGIGDVNFEGEINKYTTRPKSITANEIAAENRFTIGVKVSFTNDVEPEFNFDRSFDRYEDYSSEQSLNSVRDELTELIIDQLVEDIFNQAFVNW